MKKIKVIVVDDTALMRKIISDMINSDSQLEVIDIARNGEDLLKKLSTMTPDVITLDVEMPVVDGLAVLKEMKKMEVNIPVIMISSLTQSGAALTLDCLNLGAFDFVPKPAGKGLLYIQTSRDELVEKIKMAYHKFNSKVLAPTILLTKAQDKVVKNSAIKAIAIGASTGGPGALNSIVTALPEKIGVPVFIVQHMPVGFTKCFADRLNGLSKIKVVEAQNHETIIKDTVYIAPGGFHMEVGEDNRIHLNTEPSIWGVRPAVDKLFISASKVYTKSLLSIVLTGMGKDGAQGTIEVKKNGGITLSQDEASSVIYGMPKVAFETGLVDFVFPLSEMTINIERLLMKT